MSGAVPSRGLHERTAARQDIACCERGGAGMEPVVVKNSLPLEVIYV